ncbi:MAG: IS3 family transposase [Flavobacteriales bacterium]
MAKKKASMRTIDEKKELIDTMDEKFTIQEQCAMIDLPRSTFYYSNTGVSNEDLELMRKMDEMYLEDPTRGTRRYSDELSAEGYKLGRDRARTLMILMGISAIYPKPRTTVIDKTKYKYPYLLRNLKIERVNQVWEIDISYIPMRYGFMFLVAIIDVQSRFIVGWDISNTMEASWVIKTIKKAIKEHGAPEIINSDQGTQFTSEDYVDYIKSLKTVKISMDGKGRATDNAFIERFFRTIKHDRLYLNPSRDGHELYNECEDFINYYNNRRTHSSIGKIAPSKVYKKAA